MATDDDSQPSPRRLRMRRGGRGFAPGGQTSTTSESLRTSAEDDEVDAAVDPDQMDREVRATPPPRRPPINNTPGPGQRLAEVEGSGSRGFAREYRLTLLHRMLKRNTPLDQIARQLNCSVSTIEKDRAELNRMLREQAKSLHIDEMIGSQSLLYDEITGMALRIASDAGTVDEHGRQVGGQPTAMRLAAMRTGLAANADKNRFYTAAGVYDVLKFRRSEEGQSLSDVGMLMERTGQLLDQLLTGGDDFTFGESPDSLDDENLNL